jgi:hypothetical protein
MKTKTKNPVTIGRDDSYDGKECLKLVVADGIKALYVEMNGRTYYLDDSTGEQIAVHLGSNPLPACEDREHVLDSLMNLGYSEEEANKKWERRDF